MDKVIKCKVCGREVYKKHWQNHLWKECKIEVPKKKRLREPKANLPGWDLKQEKLL